MIDRAVIEQVRNGTCSIGYLTVRPEVFRRDLRKPFFKVLGTGFVVRENMAITNRHVISGLKEAQANLGFPDDQRLLSFVYPAPKGLCRLGFCPLQETATVENPDLDVGFIEFSRLDDSEFVHVRALKIRGQDRIRVGDPIAVCGYPYGTAMLQRNGGKIRRFGPVLQQGYVSAISPYDTATQYEELLLDVRTAGGMSGAPVFRPDGTVIGLHYAGWEATTAVALPLTQDAIEQWLAPSSV